MSTPTDSLVGETVAERYKVLSQLGSGGFGAVYMAKHVELNNPVALKVLHGHLLGDESNIARFRREATATSRLRHSAIASVFDVGVLEDGRPYMVMEYLSGRSLADILEQEGALPVERVVPLFLECCDALRYAHRQGLLHRDIKPDNIFVSRDMDGIEHAKLLDFGLAKIFFGEDGSSRINSLTETGTVLGTPWYMSPEQCQALPLDGRSDIYSLGYTLYEALAGRKAFNGTTHYEVMRAHLQRAVPPLNEPDKEPLVPAQLQNAVLRALAKAPNDRFATAEEFKKALLESLPADSLARTNYAANSPPPAGTSPTSGSESPAKTKSVSPKKVIPAAMSGGKSAAAAQATTRTIVIAVAAAVTVTAALAGAGFWCYEASKAKTPAVVPAKASLPEQPSTASSPQPPDTSPLATAKPAGATSTQPSVSHAAVVAAPVPSTNAQTARAEAVQTEVKPSTSTVAADSSPAAPSNSEQAAKDERLRKLEEKLHAMEQSTQLTAPSSTGNAESGWAYGNPAPLRSGSYLTPNSSNTNSSSQAPPNYNYASGGNESIPPAGRSFPGMPPGWRPGMPLPPGVSPPPGFPPPPNIQSAPGGFPAPRPDASSN